MRQPALLLPIALALGAAILVPGRGAQAEPTAITVCQTISQPGSYKLVNNLTATGGACLLITTGFVTIDLAGFTISGAGPTGTGIAGAEHPGIAVRNGSILGFFQGVELLGGGSIVEGLRVFGSKAGIAAQGIVRGNTVDVSDLGIIATGTVTGNDVGASDGVGIQIHPGSTVIGNTATNSLLIGIFAVCPSNLIDNTAVNNGKNLVLNGDGCHNEDNVAP
jgi:hypothetical protein